MQPKTVTLNVMASRNTVTTICLT